MPGSLNNPKEADWRVGPISVSIFFYILGSLQCYAHSIISKTHVHVVDNFLSQLILFSN